MLHTSVLGALMALAPRVLAPDRVSTSPLPADVQALPGQPVACTPASSWEKGQVENQVGLVRERFFTPRLRFKSYDELKA